ncbi:right-handed parallel beta-helix repeat-containing protein [Streptacidiphilus sp. 4-A2]|nr:right-handed parallel beta-helix repeat-containing protein [Streptacidiphilus sp. 4-A2]
MSRGNGIAFSGDSFEHLGATGVDLADGTQNSSVTGSTVTDTAAGGISVGDVDDYFQNDPDLMDSGNTISGNAISHVGQDYTDAVGIWAGYTRELTVSHNDIGHTSYSGMSIGWGWGWASPCSMQAAQGTSCVIAQLRGGQPDHRQLCARRHERPARRRSDLHQRRPGRGRRRVYSVLAGNYVSVGNDTNNMLYQDEGSSYWDTYDNVTSYSDGGNWIGMWTPTINHITVGPADFTDNPNTDNNGTDISYTGPTVVSGNAWPAAAQSVMSGAGLAPTGVSGGVADNDSQLLSYAGTWSAHGTPGGDDRHSTTTTGASVTLPFTGGSIALVADKGPGQGNAQILIDGVSRGTVSGQANTQETGQTLFAADGLPAGAHTIQVADTGGGGLTVDSFQTPAQPYLTTVNRPPSSPRARPSRSPARSATRPVPG